MKLKFQSRLERLAPGINYFAVSVPAKITKTLGTHGPVPVMAQVNDSPPFLISLYPVGGGRHKIRVRGAICKAARIGVGDRVRVEIEVRDRKAEVSVPKDVASALRAQGALEKFKTLPIGKRAHLLRWIEAAAKPETREKRIQSVIELTSSRPEKPRRSRP